ncbi:MAG: S9 family peptidase [Asgard group archaeon]|nr:S9 family peptidase [Asgard group archaeon]
MSENESSKELIQINDLFNLKQISEPTFRPTTNEVYYGITQAIKDDNGYRKAIWRYLEEPKQFTQGLPNDSSLKWSPDGKTLAFISMRMVLNPKNTEPPKPQIFLIPHNGGEAVQLTNMLNGVTPPFEWSKDGKKIIFISRLNEDELNAPTPDEMKDWDQDEVLVYTTNKKKLEEKKVEPRIITKMVYRSGTSFFDDRNGQIHVLDLETKKVDRWANSTTDDFGFAYLAPDNSYALSSRQKPGEENITRNYEIVKITPDGEIKIIVDDFYTWGGDFVLSPDGKTIATTVDNKELGTLGISKLCLIDVETGTKKIVAEDIDNEKFMLTWSEDSKKLYFIVMEKARSTIRCLDIEIEKIITIVEGDRLIIGFDVSKDGEWITFQAHHVNDPSKLYRLNIKTKKEELLDAPNKEFLANRKLGQTEEVWYPGNNGDFQIQGWILTPPDFDPEKKYPLALNMHGGPHVMWSHHQGIPMFHEFQLLAAEGYVVYYCNPRGSNGYGQKFFQAIEKSWGDDDSQDILLGVDLVVNRGYIDKKRMAITGGSYAGFMTAWIIGHDNRFAAAVSQRGVYFLSSFWATTDSARLLIDDEFGTTPLEGSDFLWKRSPAAYAKNITTPLRIIHSDLDYRAPIPDAEMLYAAVKQAHPDLDLEFVRYPGEGHELSRSGQPNRRLDRLEKIIEWFDKYCQPKKIAAKKNKDTKIKNIKDDYRKKIQEKIKEIKKDQ